MARESNTPVDNLSDTQIFTKNEMPIILILNQDFDIVINHINILFE